jgi:catechol 2,3-dioxygenase-like lactoylglutathione lyase family enzyme
MPRGLDHLVLAVRDLDAAARFYERLGFQVGAQNRHPWGTENRIVQLAGSFLELITVGAGARIEEHGKRRYSFGAFVRDYLERREGLAMLVLDSENAPGDATLFAQAGLGDFEPFFFERKARDPQGAEVPVGFTLAFAQDADAPLSGFFVCQPHRPENYWNPEFQRHPNGALALSAVAYAVPNPEAHRAFLATLTGAIPARPGGHDLSFPLERGRLDVMTSDDAAEIYGSVEVEPHSACFVAYAVRLAEAEAQAHRLDAAAVPYQRIGSRLVVPASAAFGVAIAFEPT